MNEPDDTLLDKATAILAAYLSANQVAPENLPGLFETIAQNLLRLRETLEGGATSSTANASFIGYYPPMTPRAEQRLREALDAKGLRPSGRPAVPIERSTTPDAVFCLECGDPFKVLSRHLTTHELTPDEYKAKWGLPKDYSLTAAAYGAERAAIAKRTEDKRRAGIDRKSATRKSP